MVYTHVFDDSKTLIDEQKRPIQESSLVWRSQDSSRVNDEILIEPKVKLSQRNAAGLIPQRHNPFYYQNRFIPKLIYYAPPKKEKKDKIKRVSQSEMGEGIFGSYNPITQETELLHRYPNSILGVGVPVHEYIHSLKDNKLEAISFDKIRIIEAETDASTYSMTGIKQMSREFYPTQWLMRN